MPATIAWNRKPLPQNRFAPLPLTTIRARGWLKEAVRAAPVDTPDDRLTQAGVLMDKPLLDAERLDIDKIITAGEPPKPSAIRALMRFHGMTADVRAVSFLLRYARDLRDALARAPFFSANEAADIGDLLRMSIWLYNLTGQKALIELCWMLRAQAPDWMSTFHVFPQTKAVADKPDPATDAYWRVHGKTIAAALKTPALQAVFEGGYKNETGFRVGWDKLQYHHGVANGLFNADPLLAGPNPSRFVEAGVVSELLNSLETLLFAQSSAFAADLWEFIAFNALPAAKGAQAANQLIAGSGSMASGFSQYAASLWMASQDGGLAAMGFAPCEVRWHIAGQTVRLFVETDYPREETVRICVRMKKPAPFPIHLRIPGWAQGASLTINDEPAQTCAPGFHTVERCYQDGDILTLHLPMAVKTSRWYHHSIAVERGPLLYALSLEENDSVWQMAILPDSEFTPQVEGGVLVLKAQAAPAASWGKKGLQPSPLPISPPVLLSQARQIALIPYGRTGRRITQFPVGIIKEEPR